MAGSAVTKKHTERERKARVLGPKKGPRLVNLLTCTETGGKAHSATGAPFKASFTQPSNQRGSDKYYEICPIRIINHHLWRNREE